MFGTTLKNAKLLKVLIYSGLISLGISDVINVRYCVSISYKRSFSDALSCKVQIINGIGLQFQQNLLKVNTNIVLYQNLVKDAILQI